ncbi:PIN2/TERF1-interacting telomerase inhibitor 1 [Cloeon dipterum]|uniref:PIN2/TERF1-interacting telomerase inhibitor 1 n=1 Tax=Cloeon dipterum TaxID=197152 RepID=UPI00321F8ABB
MLAERRYKAHYVLNPRNHSWTADTDNVGKKLMERMGWSKGKGLGREEQGTTEHIRVTYKNDNKGMGYTGPVDDPVLHQNAFNELLLQLNQEKEPVPIKPESLSSLEKRSESTRRRVHYKKFTRGKDLSRYSAKDLECIVGSGIKKKKKEEPEAKEEIPKTEDEGHSHGVETITGGLIADYFRKKMIERGLATPKVEYEKDEKDQDFGFVGFKMNEEVKQEVEAESKKESKKKKKSKKLRAEETDAPENLGKTTFEKEEPNFAFVGFKMSEEQVDQPECINLKKKKKKKAKSENLEIPEHAKNVIEPDTLQKKDKRKKLKRKAGQESIDNVLNSEAELHITKKKKKNRNKTCR